MDRPRARSVSSNEWGESWEKVLYKDENTGAGRLVWTMRNPQGAATRICGRPRVAQWEYEAAPD